MLQSRAEAGANGCRDAALAVLGSKPNQSGCCAEGILQGVRRAIHPARGRQYHIPTFAADVDACTLEEPLSIAKGRARSQANRTWRPPLGVMWVRVGGHHHMSPATHPN